MRDAHRFRGGCDERNGERALRRAKRDWLESASSYGVTLDEELLDSLLRRLQARSRQQGRSLEATMYANIRRFLEQTDDEGLAA
jgi:hypothetical protein